MMSGNKIRSLFLLFFLPINAWSQGDPVAEWSRDGCRIYASTSADLDGDGTEEIVAVGQINRGDSEDHSAFIVLLRPEGSRIRFVAEYSFNIEIDGEKLPTRIRSVQLLRDGTDGDWNVFTAGKGGSDDEAAGFLHQAIIRDDRIRKKDEKIIRSLDSTADHGYPLAVADLDGDDGDEIIYGGFHRQDNLDRADVRVYKLIGGELQEAGRPFEALDIPFRINALEAGDLDGDGNNDIVIAGRSGQSEEREFSAFAWWTDGRIARHVYDEANPSRLRTVLIADLDGDGKNELITGGRLELEGIWLADLRCWILDRGQLLSRDRFNWSLGRRIRLRALSVSEDRKDSLIAAGRAERKDPDGAVRWAGFIWRFSFNGSRLLPLGSPDYFDRGLDTRVRHLHLTGEGSLLASGFSKAQGKEENDRGLIWLMK
jgi:hypothetical protein